MEDFLTSNYISTEYIVSEIIHIIDEKEAWEKISDEFDDISQRRRLKFLRKYHQYSVKLDQYLPHQKFHKSHPYLRQGPNLDPLGKFIMEQLLTDLYLDSSFEGFCDECGAEYKVMRANYFIYDLRGRDLLFCSYSCVAVRLAHTFLTYTLPMIGTQLFFTFMEFIVDEETDKLRQPVYEMFDTRTKKLLDIFWEYYNRPKHFAGYVTYFSKLKEYYFRDSWD